MFEKKVIDQSQNHTQYSGMMAPVAYCSLLLPCLIFFLSVSSVQFGINIYSHGPKFWASRVLRIQQRVPCATTQGWREGGQSQAQHVSAHVYRPAVKVKLTGISFVQTEIADGFQAFGTFTTPPEAHGNPTTHPDSILGHADSPHLPLTLA